MIEDKIINGLLVSEEYMRKVHPYIHKEYFKENKHKNVLYFISNYISKYNKIPSKEIIETELEQSNLSENEYKETQEYISSLKSDFVFELNWLVDKTELYCKERALYNALFESVSIVEGNSKTKLDKGAIPKILSDALSVSFDKNVGHDYIHDIEKRYEYYTSEEYKIPFDIEKLNKITNGGIGRKTFTIFLGGTGTGKSLVMCHLAASYIMNNLKVLYISMEMSEEKIAERIDSNLMNIPISEIKNIQKNNYLQKIKSIINKTSGNLIIKDYPTASAHAGHFRYLINELKEKKNFIPDVIIIDYLNICASERYKANANNMYLLNKAIAEELRGLAIEFNVPIISGTQTNRDGINSSDLSLTNISESMGTAHTSDLILGLITTEELEKQEKMLIKQLKNRYNDPSRDKIFAIGVDRSRMKLYDVSDSDQIDSSPDISVFDMSNTNEKMKKKFDFKFDLN